MADSTSGFALAAILAGSVFLFAGVRGVSVLKSLQAVIQGKNPSTVTPTQGITGLDLSVTTTADVTTTGGGGSIGSGGSAKAVLQSTAATFGWTGNQWTCLDHIEMSEAGYDTLATNPSSGAFGMAQSLGHAGTRGTHAAEYGGYGLTSAQERAANSGDAGAQSLWMCRYIKSAYGNPCNAWAHEQSHHWY